MKTDNIILRLFLKIYAHDCATDVAANAAAQQRCFYAGRETQHGQSHNGKIQANRRFLLGLGPTAGYLLDVATVHFAQLLPFFAGTNPYSAFAMPEAM